MTKVIILGHGGYATMIKGNLEMLVGEVEGFHYIDFNIGDDLEVLKYKITNTISIIGSDPILFACDLTGGSPFREACLQATENKEYCVVGGLNTAGYSEISYNLELEAKPLAELGIEASKASIMIFSQELMG